MKRLVQSFSNFFFDIDFTKSIADGIRDYNRLCGYKLTEQAVGQNADERKMDSTVVLHQHLAIDITGDLKIAE